MARLQKSASCGAGSLKHESCPEIEIRKYTPMSIAIRKTGFEVVGDIPWGTHFCLFYETKVDLIEIAVAYCTAGLVAHEFCLWVVADPLTVDEATRALKRAVPDCDRYFADGSIEIVRAPDWYLPDGAFDLNRVIRGWNEKLARASARGYAGVRVTGDTAWLERKGWGDFCEYEELLNHAVSNQRIAVLCTYPLASCGAAEILDVVRNHQFAVTRRRGNWDVIETAGHKQAKAEIKRLNEELEHRVVERTSELTALNTELTKEVLQRQRAEKALLRSESYLAEAQRASRTGSFGWSVSSGEIVWSDETFRILDLDPANKPTVEFILQRTHPEDRAFVQRILETVARDRKPLDVEHRLLMSDGSVKYVRVVGHPSTNHESGDFEFVGAVSDITDRKRAEEALRRSEGYLTQAQSLTQSGSWAWNVHTDTRFWSQETFRIFGYDPGKMKPNWSDILERTHPDDRGAIEQQAKLEATRKEDSEFDWRIVLPDGGIKHLHSISHPVMDESGQIIEVVGTLMDVTERTRAKQERERLRQLQADLAHINRVTTMGELTASLAHEIKQPMTAALTDARTCLRWLRRDEPDVSEAREAASRLVIDVSRAAEIISRISLLFKKAAPQRELVDVNDLILEMIVLLRNEAARYSISIRSNLADDLPNVMADRIQLQQVFMNLMLNGIEAMKDTETGSELIVSSRRGEGAQVLFSVADAGAGLPPEIARNVFDAFYTTKPQGTGMGLPISRSIIESHGGRLWAIPNSRRGTIFLFTLPTEVTAHQAVLA